MSQLKIKIKLLNGQVAPRKIDKGDWIDLRTNEDVYLREGEMKLIPLGVAMQLPEGYEAVLAPRSSTFKNFGILQTNAWGIIDESYCGDEDEWKFPAYATRDINIPVGSRICQFRIQKKMPEVEFEICESLGNESRKGFGSSGIY